MKRTGLTIIIILFVILPLSTLTSLESKQIQTSTPRSNDTLYETAANPPIENPFDEYLLLRMTGSSYPDHSTRLAEVLNVEGIPITIRDVSTLSPNTVGSYAAVIIDTSVGDCINDTVFDLLTEPDVPLILVGRSAWVLHRLCDYSPPSSTAPLYSTLTTNSEYEGAVFYSSPSILDTGQQITTESVQIPIETANDCVVSNLTGSDSSTVAPLRFISCNIDVFLFGPEDPDMMTDDGLGLLINTIAFSTALRENQIAVTMNAQQSSGILEGGFSYPHTPTLDSAYFACSAIFSLSNSSEWDTWRTENHDMLKSLLESLYTDLGTESAFSKLTDGTHDLKHTSMGLWLVEVMNLQPYFDTTELSQYILSRQDTDGSFDNSMETTYHALKALDVSVGLGGVDTGQLETWLESCVLSGSQTSDPALWGGVVSNPSSLSPKTRYASMFATCYEILGTTYANKAKICDWILDEMQNSDGSYQDDMIPSDTLTTGTASSLLTLNKFGQLNSENKTSGLTWLSSNQLDSGGFGVRDKLSDVVGRVQDSYFVSLSLDELGEESSPTADSLISFFESCKTNVGFEAMYPIPSLMWTYWISLMTRHAHSLIDLESLKSYLDMFSQWRMYPALDNMTTIYSDEYMNDQYGMRSVWAHYFGTSVSELLGHDIPSGKRSDTISHLDDSQYFSGHYRPAPYMGTAHMQYSVAAVETLYLLDALDTIPYRTSLENKVLDEYNGGTWSDSGWTLRPFASSQSAIDFLCTRTALRLGILTSQMKSEIWSSVTSRIQYSDLWDLSMDMKTMLLLDDIDTVLEVVNTSHVLTSLGSDSFGTGWFNETTLSQPVYSAGVLELISKTGIRAQLYEIEGHSIAVDCPNSVDVGSTLDVDVTITSGSSTHTVYVHVFDTWYESTSVANTDTITISVPYDGSFLGTNDIQAVLWDYGDSRAFAYDTFETYGTLDGTLDLHTSEVLVDDSVNATINWSLMGGDAGVSNVTCEITNSTYSESWEFYTTSPLDVMLDTNMSAGVYDLIVTIECTNCNPLVLTDTLSIEEPVLTYISADSLIEVDLGEDVSITWSLHYLENHSLISGKSVGIEVYDSTNSLVYQASGITGFLWTPSERGSYTYILEFQRDGQLEGSDFNGSIYVFDQPEIEWSGNGTQEQYGTIEVAILLTSNDTPLSGFDIHLIVEAPSSTVVFDGSLVTNSTGHVSINVDVQENGNYFMSAQFDAEDFLLSVYSETVMKSYSESTIIIEDLQIDGLVTDTWKLYAKLVDSAFVPLSGKQLSVTVTLAPSTVVHEAICITNSTGQILELWSPDSAGTYIIEFDYDGSPSRSPATESRNIAVRIPVSLDLTSSSFEVSTQGWFLVTAVDHTMAEVSGPTVNITITDSSDTVVFFDSMTLVDGFVNFSWTPQSRGSFEIQIESSRYDLYADSYKNGQTSVYAQPAITLTWDEVLIAPNYRLLNVKVSTGGIGLSGVTFSIDARIGSTILLNSINTTDVDGTIVLEVDLTAVGTIRVTLDIAEQDFLYAHHHEEDYIVLGESSIDLNLPGYPIKQGTQLGIVATLTDWEGQPITGASVLIGIYYPNGTLIISETRTTGIGGTCSISWLFGEIGDFSVQANFSGEGTHSSSFESGLQRVRVTPDLVLEHTTSIIVGEGVIFQISVLDFYGQYVSGLVLNLTLSIDSTIIHQQEIVSSSTTKDVSWIATDRGQMKIQLEYIGDEYYLANSTQSTMSVFESATGVLVIPPGSIDLFQNVTINFTLSDCQEIEGVSIIIEVLGSDLVPLWSVDVTTNSQGSVSVLYVADSEYGVLLLQATPAEEEFLIGAVSQSALTVKTEAVVSVTLLPEPAVVESPTNITIEVLDEFDEPVDSITVKVSLYEPDMDPVKLGTFFNYIMVDVTDGIAVVEFTPTTRGAYIASVEFSGSSTVKAFDSGDVFLTVFAGTYIDLEITGTELEVGETVFLTATLFDYQSTPMTGRTLTITLSGPGTDTGPEEVITDGNGEITWDGLLDDEGVWTVTVIFDGYATYLQSSEESPVHAHYGSWIDVEYEPKKELIAGTSVFDISVLLLDSADNPLEGRTLYYSLFHYDLGVVHNGSVVQSGSNFELVTIPLEQMGNFTVLVEFLGTEHYYSSSVGIDIFVLGTSTIVFEVPEGIDRNTNESLHVIALDELGNTLAFDTLIYTMTLTGPDSEIDVKDMIIESSDVCSLNLTGLEIGDYRIDIDVQNSTSRVGCSAFHNFNVTTLSSFEIVESELPAIVDSEHSLQFSLCDSIGDKINDSILVSIFNPHGNEIYGSFLTTKTSLEPVNGLFDLSWTPSSPGEYRVVLTFDGAEYINGTTLEVKIHTRYTSSLSVIPSETEISYRDSLGVDVELESDSVDIKNADIVLNILNNGTVLEDYTTTVQTSYYGLAYVEIDGLLAGEYTVFVMYNGSEVYMPSEEAFNITVLPDYALVVRPGLVYLGDEYNITVNIDVMGVSPDWYGTLTVEVFDDDRRLISDESFTVSSVDTVHLQLSATELGNYSVTVLLHLPVLDRVEVLHIIEVVTPPAPITLDSGTVPVGIGGAIIALIGFVLKKKLDGNLDTLSSEWTS